MSEKSLDHFHREVAAFIERYAPRSSYGRDFEHDLRILMSMAYEEAQRPFVYELNRLRDSALDQSMLRPTQSVIRDKAL